MKAGAQGWTIWGAFPAFTRIQSPPGEGNPWAASLGGDGKGTSPRHPQSPQMENRSGINFRPPVPLQDLRISPRKCCQTTEPWTEALCLQTGHSSTFTPSFGFAKLLRPIKVSLRLFVLTLQLYLVALFFFRWQTFWGGKQLGQKVNHIPNRFWEKT